MRIGFKLNIAFVSSKTELSASLTKEGRICKNVRMIPYKNYDSFLRDDSNEFDLVVFNFNEGDIDCFSFIDLIQFKYSNMPIIILSKDIDSAVVRSLFYGGVEEFVSEREDYFRHLKVAFDYHVLQHRHKLIAKKIYKKVVLPAITEIKSFKQLKQLALAAKSFFI